MSDIFYPTIVPSYVDDWISPDFRTREQLKHTDEFHERIGEWGDLSFYVRDMPTRLLDVELERIVQAELLPRPYQVTGSCLPSDSMVMTERNEVTKISDLVPGDWVLTHTEHYRQVVGMSCKYTDEQMRHLSIGGGQKLRCTDRHRVAVSISGGIEWREAETVEPGMKLLTVGVSGLVGSTVVSNVAMGVPRDPVWDIEVEEDHTFIADGFVVHNCVGVGWFRAFCNAMIGDIVIRGDVEDASLPFWPATYGVGRQLGGMNGKGEGSYGAVQAESGKEFGTLPINYSGLPQPVINNGWMNYTKQEELTWSHPSAWPMDKDKLQDVARDYGIGQYKRLTSAKDVKEAKSQGYGVTLASNFGTRGCRVESDVLLAEWNGSWAHQMSCGGYWEHPTLGLLLVIDNQWKDVHGKCPTLEPLGVVGSFWIKASTMDRICETGEVYGHTATGGFKLTSVDWKNLGITYT